MVQQGRQVVGGLGVLGAGLRAPVHRRRDHLEAAVDHGQTEQCAVGPGVVPRVDRGPEIRELRGAGLLGERAVVDAVEVRRVDPERTSSVPDERATGGNAALLGLLHGVDRVRAPGRELSLGEPANLAQGGNTPADPFPGLPGLHDPSVSRLPFG